MSRSKWIAALILLGLLWGILRKWIIVVLIIIVILFLIRVGADIFWYGKDSGKW